jgi:hypothetical protein
MRLPAAAGALFPLAGEEKKSKIEAERHRPDSVALTARARQRPQRALKAATAGSSRLSRNPRNVRRNPVGSSTFVARGKEVSPRPGVALREPVCSVS